MSHIIKHVGLGNCYEAAPPLMCSECRASLGHPCGRCGMAEGAGAAGLCLKCDELGDLEGVTCPTCGEAMVDDHYGCEAMAALLEGRSMSAMVGCAVPVFQLLQWKYAMRLEALGMRHSSGRSVRAHAGRVLGVKRKDVAAKVDALLAQASAEGECDCNGACTPAHALGCARCGQALQGDGL